MLGGKKGKKSLLLSGEGDITFEGRGRSMGPICPGSSAPPDGHLLFLPRVSLTRRRQGKHKEKLAEAVIP